MVDSLLRGAAAPIRARRSARARRAAAALSVAATALGIALSPLSSGPARADASCTSSGTTYCLQITSADPTASGTALDVEDLGNGHSYLRMAGGDRPSSVWAFQLNQDSTFLIRNASTGNCVDVSLADSRLDQMECAGQTSQNWYVEPFAADSASYRIRQVDTGLCMTLVDDQSTNLPQHPQRPLLPIKLTKQVKVQDCGTQITQQWNLGAS